MKELSEKDILKVSEFLDLHPAEGTFFRSDLEYFGIRSNFHRFFEFTGESGIIDGLLLHFYKSISVLGVIPSTSLILENFCNYVKSNHIEWVSGLETTFWPILRSINFNKKNLYDSLFFMTTNETSFKPFNNCWNVSTCNDNDLYSVYLFARSMPEFSNFPPFERFQDECATGMRKVYCVYENTKLIGSASIIASNSKSGMIAAVCTLPEYRSRGIGRSLVSKATHDLLGSSKIPCLTQNHSEAESLYSKLGFVSRGIWQICEGKEITRAVVNRV